MLNAQKPKLLILGAGGYGKTLAEVAELVGDWSEICFIDDQWPALTSKKNYPVISDIAHLNQIDIANCVAIAAVGNNNVRKQWHDLVKSMGIALVSIVHPHAVISPSAQVMQGVSIMAGCILGTDVVINEGCILNSGVLIDHDVSIGQYTHLGLGVKILAEKDVPELSFLQAGTVFGNQ